MGSNGRRTSQGDVNSILSGWDEPSQTAPDSRDLKNSILSDWDDDDAPASKGASSGRRKPKTTDRKPAKRKPRTKPSSRKAKTQDHDPDTAPEHDSPVPQDPAVDAAATDVPEVILQAEDPSGMKSGAPEPRSIVQTDDSSIVDHGKEEDDDDNLFLGGGGFGSLMDEEYGDEDEDDRRRSLADTDDGDDLLVPPPGYIDDENPDLEDFGSLWDTRNLPAGIQEDASKSKPSKSRGRRSKSTGTGEDQHGSSEVAFEHEDLTPPDPVGDTDAPVASHQDSDGNEVFDLSLLDDDYDGEDDSLMPGGASGDDLSYDSEDDEDPALNHTTTGTQAMDLPSGLSDSLSSLMAPLQHKTSAGNQGHDDVPSITTPTETEHEDSRPPQFPTVPPAGSPVMSDGDGVGHAGNPHPTDLRNDKVRHTTDNKDALEDLFDSYEQDLSEIEEMRRRTEEEAERNRRPLGKIRRAHDAAMARKRQIEAGSMKAQDPSMGHGGTMDHTGIDPSTGGSAIPAPSSTRSPNAVGAPAPSPLDNRSPWGGGGFDNDPQFQVDDGSWEGGVEDLEASFQNFGDPSASPVPSGGTTAVASQPAPTGTTDGVPMSYNDAWADVHPDRHMMPDLPDQSAPAWGDRGLEDEDVDLNPYPSGDGEDGMGDAPMHTAWNGAPGSMGSSQGMDEDLPSVDHGSRPSMEDYDPSAASDPQGMTYDGLGANPFGDPDDDDNDTVIPLGDGVLDEIDEGDSFDLGYDDQDEANDTPEEQEEESSGMSKSLGGRKLKRKGLSSKEADDGDGPKDAASEDGEGQDGDGSSDGTGVKSLLKGGGSFKEKILLLISQMRSEFHGGGKTNDDGKDAPAFESQSKSKGGLKVGAGDAGSDGTPKGKRSLPSPKAMVSNAVALAKDPKRLVSTVRSAFKTARKTTWIIIAVVTLVVGVWGGSNIPAMTNKGGVSDDAVDEGTVSLVGTSWSDGRAKITMRNGSDMIAHVTGTAEVRSWAPTWNPTTWLTARVTSSCKVPAVEVDPGAEKTVDAICGHTSGVWHRIRAHLTYE